MTDSALIEDAFKARLEPFQTRLGGHPLYRKITDQRSVIEFMQVHVFAVWDFMNLVKGLQNRLTSVSVPWIPSPHPVERRFINQIVLDEESDVDGNHQPRSHFEMYADAMVSAGADVTPISRFIDALLAGRSVEEGLDGAGASDPIRDFVQGTIRFAEGDLPELAAVFAYSRELVIPDMFRKLVARLSDAEPLCFGPFAHYLDRHIASDEEMHGPISRQLVARLVGRDRRALDRAVEAAVEALKLRLILWDEVVRRIDSIPAREMTVVEVPRYSRSRTASWASAPAGLYV
jgi:hypothetical protein